MQKNFSTSIKNLKSKRLSLRTRRPKVVSWIRRVSNKGIPSRRRLINHNRKFKRKRKREKRRKLKLQRIKPL